MTVVLMSLLCGCGTAGTIAATRGEEGLRFDFSIRGVPGLTMEGLDVFEVDHGKRGNTVCSLRVKAWSPNKAVSLTQWTYGEDSRDGQYQVRACAPLVPDRTYGILVFRYDNRIDKSRFRVAADGAVTAVPIDSE
jgi:hypothetical protein